MAKGTIDPAFQAAPFLGESSHDPIEFARRQKAIKFKVAEQKRDEMNRNIQTGLDKLMLDVKGWEDQEGFKEIMARQDKALKLFTDLSKKGLNLTAPKTSQEIEAYRAINNYHAETKQLVDEWDRNKKAYDLITEAIKQDSMKPESERKIDADATRLNVDKTMSGKSIKDRKMTVENLLVFKPEVGDVHDYVAKNLEFIPKPDVVMEPITDPDTGQTVNRQREVESPDYLKKKEEALRNMYRTAPQRIKNGVIAAKKQDAELGTDTKNIMSDEDYFVSMYSPAFKQKFIDKKVGTGGAGFDFNFLGTRTKIEPGTLRPEPLTYGNKTFTGTYIFKPTTKALVVPVGEISEQFSFGKWNPISRKEGQGGGTVEATLYAYDPQSDSFIFNTTASNKSPWVDNNTAILVPRSVIGKDADNLPVIVNGEKKTLKDVFDLAPIAEKKTSIPKGFWSGGIYIPKKK